LIGAPAARIDIHATGIIWSLVYLLIIYRSYRDRSCGMPVAALVMNLGWEFFDGFISNSPICGIYSIIWLFLDLAILLACVRARWHERPASAAMALLAAAACYASILYLASRQGGSELLTSAFPQNLLMSLLFVLMIRARKDSLGQSFYIGLLKFLGTFTPIAYVFLHVERLPALLVFLFLSISLLDLYYIYLYLRLYRGRYRLAFCR